MRDLHVFSAGAPQSRIQSQFRQGASRVPLVLGRTAHVGGRLGDIHHRLTNSFELAAVDCLSAQKVFRLQRRE